MNEQTRIEIEAETLRALLQHLREHPEAQNIDLMILADFCRNCLAKWYGAAAQAHGVELSYAQAQEIIYGMPYAEWKQKHQAEATPEQLQAFEARQKRRAEATGSPAA
jgi:hypothetical protein